MNTPFLNLTRWLTLTCGLAAFGASTASAATNLLTPDRPLSLAECVNLALQQNTTVRKSLKDLEVAHGIVVQTRAIAIPKLQVAGDYSVHQESAVDRLELPIPPELGLGAVGIDPGEQQWSTSIRLVQSIYEGGRLRSALRTAKLTRASAVAQHDVVLASVVLEVRTAFYDALLAGQQIQVQQASIRLLEAERTDANRRVEAGTVPRFNLLRADVALANAQPRLIRARNAYRIAKINLANLLGFDVPRDLWEEIPLRLAGSLDEFEPHPFDLELPDAIVRALDRRPELEALRVAAQLRQQGITDARSGALPSLQAFAGYGWRKSMFSSDLDDEVSGWQAGLQMNWNVFDGFRTKGRLAEARARRERAALDIEEATRQIQLEVRTAFSDFVQAQEVLASQTKVQEQAEEAHRLAIARAEAGTGTQLDVLDAQTSLTEARTTRIQARRDYAVALARLERAIGRSSAATSGDR